MLQKMLAEQNNKANVMKKAVEKVSALIEVEYQRMELLTEKTPQNVF